jgi:hypothetical protein
MAYMVYTVVSEAGIRVESLGTLELRDSVRYRLKWYTALVLKSTKSIARLKGITNT